MLEALTDAYDADAAAIRVISGGELPPTGPFLPARSPDANEALTRPRARVTAVDGNGGAPARGSDGTGVRMSLHIIATGARLPVRCAFERFRVLAAFSVAFGLPVSRRLAPASVARQRRPS